MRLLCSLSAISGHSDIHSITSSAMEITTGGTSMLAAECTCHFDGARARIDPNHEFWRGVAVGVTEHHVGKGPAYLTAPPVMPAMKRSRNKL